MNPQSLLRELSLRLTAIWRRSAALSVIAALAHLGTASAKDGATPNILFIICDDLNFQDLGPAHTPNLDKLLGVSTQFKGYPNFPWCNPSRASLLAGLRPEAIGIYNNEPKPAQVLSNRYWLPKAINESGYYTVGVGKIPHQGASGYNVPGWDRYLYPRNVNPPLATATIIPYSSKAGNEVAYWDDSVQLRDESYRNAALTLISDAKKQSDPWFVGVGFKKPHGPWYSHRSDWEANGFLNEDGTANLDSIPDLDMNPALPVKNYPSPAPKFNPKTNLVNAKYFRMGYRSCITHIDGLVGDLLEEVDTDPADPGLNLPSNLAVIFTSDHGYGTFNLGARVEGKLTPFEAGNRMPLWVHMPGQTEYQDRRDIIVELVDLYPTILDLAGHPKAVQGTLQTHGQSLKPHLLSGDWTGWNNWASTVIVNVPQEKRWKRVATSDLTSYHQLWNTRATLFANRDYTWTNPNSGTVHNWTADPEHWCNLSQSPRHPLVLELQALHPAPTIPQNLEIDLDSENQVIVTFFAEKGLRYTISASENMKTWEEVELVDGANAEVSRSYEAAPQITRFFRVDLWIDPLSDFSFKK